MEFLPRGQYLSGGMVYMIGESTQMHVTLWLWLKAPALSKTNLEPWKVKKHALHLPVPDYIDTLHLPLSSDTLGVVILTKGESEFPATGLIATGEHIFYTYLLLSKSQPFDRLSAVL